MTGIIFSSIIISAIFFSFLFWILTFIAKSLYSNKYFNYKLNFYECGFKSLTKSKVVYEINYIMVILFLVIYDGEFLILIPFSFNINVLSFSFVLAIVFFMTWLLIALLFDYAYNALEWQN